jgi:PIN domain nuclease of toxin-antitoxin system
VVLDAWAVVALLRDESSAERVEQLIDAGEASISSVNLGEVLYTLLRSHGSDLADGLVAGVRDGVRVIDPDWPLVQAAARIKAGGPLSYADAFSVATGARYEAPVATGDPEILALRDSVAMIDLREGR